MNKEKIDEFIEDCLIARIQKSTKWSEEELSEAFTAYKQFVELKVLLKDWNALLLSPSLLIDQIWHSHVLDTKGYSMSCLRLCNKIIHHDPDGDVDVEKRKIRVQRTKDTFREYFGYHCTGKMWYFEDIGFMSDILYNECNSSTKK